MATIGQLILLTTPWLLAPATGYLRCDGRTVSQSKYPALYDVIGNAFGDAPDGFKLPNLPLPPGVLGKASFYICASGTGPTLADPDTCVARAIQFAFQPTLPLPAGWTRPASQQTIPPNCLPCDGRTLSIADYTELFAEIGLVYGGNGATTVMLPNVPTDPTLGWGMPHQGFCLASSGNFYPDGEDDYVGQIVLTPTPSGPWQLPGFFSERTDLLPCNGALFELNQYIALFSIIGTTYGGNGVNNFATPKLAPPAGLSGHSYFIQSGGLFPPVG